MHHERGGSGRPRGAGHSAIGLGHHTPSGLSTCRAAGEGTQGLSKFCEMLTLTHRSKQTGSKVESVPQTCLPLQDLGFYLKERISGVRDALVFCPHLMVHLPHSILLAPGLGGVMLCDAIRCGRSWLLLIPCKGHFLHVEVVGEVAKAIASNVSWDSAGFCAHGPFRPCPGTTRRHPAWI